MGRGRSEADTCREMILPALREAGWRDDQVRAEYPVEAGRVISLGGVERALGRGRIDFVLEIVPGLPVGVIEAKREYRTAAEGLGQAVRYAEQLDVPVTYASNGATIIEKDLSRGTERTVEAFRSPAELWSDFLAHHRLDADDARLLQQPFNRKKRDAHQNVAALRWYQQVAVNRVLTGIARGEKRLLLLMATGTGKTFTAMQIVHKLRAYARLTDVQGTYRVLYLADRDALVSQPMMKDFGVGFGAEPLARVLGGNDGKSRDILFATYQSLATPGADTLGGYSPDFFDLVIVDECHRGSAAAESQWRSVLDHFSPAVQLGLTATPRREETVDTYQYFGDPVFTYSLRQGIEDGYLAPYRVRRVVLDVDADGWEPEPGQVDDDGFLIEEGVYGTRDFERTLQLTRRTEVVARYLVERLREARGKMIVFCVDVDHAHRMRAAMANYAPDWSRDDPEWVVRITGVDEDKVRLTEQLSDPDRDSPRVATTSRLLATGVDVEDLRYVVIFRPVGSQIEFKQIIGRGTRLFPAGGKTSFEVIDFVGASSHFADPDFDGFPAATIIETPDGRPVPAPDDDSASPIGPIDDPGGPGIDPHATEVAEPVPPFEPGNPPGSSNPPDADGAPDPDDRTRHRRHIVGDADVSLLAQSLLVPDTTTGALRLTDYGAFVAGRVRSLADSPGELAGRWARKPDRDTIRAALAEVDIDLDSLEGDGGRAADPFDLLVALAWDQPTRTRAERARAVRERHHAELSAMSAAARQVIEALLVRYETSGIDDAISPESLNLPPISDLGARRDVVRALGEPGWPGTVAQLQEWIYSTETVA